MQIFIDKAEVLHVELTNHFDQFGQQAHTMREIDQELCHHTGLAGWDLTVWPLEVGNHEVWSGIIALMAGPWIQGRRVITSPLGHY